MSWRYLIAVVIVFNSCAGAEEDSGLNEIAEESISEQGAFEDGPVLDGEGEDFEDWEMGDVDIVEFDEEVMEENFLKWNADSFDLELDSTLVSPWTFSHLYQVVMSEWPEAYEEFVDITFEHGVDRIDPEKISFLVPTAKLAQIDSVEIENRFDRVTLKMKDSKRGCEHYEIGESTTYSWQAWDDKVVTKITFYFMFLC
jgi:hypothetical protein